MGDMQLRADFGQMDQGSADLGTQAGNVDEYRSQLRNEAMRALGNFGGGAGSEQHNAAMAKVDQLVDEHVQAVRQQQTGLNNATGSFQAASSKMKGVLGAG
jgi:uncharacterized protein YukE